VNDIEDRLREVLTTEAARTRDDMVRPLREARTPARRGLAGAFLGRPGSRQARRWLAPAAAVAAVAVLLGGVSLAGSSLLGRGGHARTSLSRSARTSSSALPRYYMSVTAKPRVFFALHNLSTGRVVVSDPLLGAVEAPGTSPWIAAAASGRAFDILITLETPSHTSELVLYRLVVSAGRRPDVAAIGQTANPGGAALPPPPSDMQYVISGLALTPSGGKVAIALNLVGRGTHPRALPTGWIEELSPTGRGVRAWSSGRVSGLVSDPAWETGGRKLGFLWWGHITYHPVLTATTQQRVLDTASDRGGLLDSRVLSGGGSTGSLASSELTPDGSGAIQTTWANHPGRHGRGEVDVSVRGFRREGHSIAIYFIQHREYRYSSPVEESAEDASCRVLSETDQFQDALITCPQLERLEIGAVTPLPSLGPNPIVAW
jgi:hypothetical protein